MSNIKFIVICLILQFAFAMKAHAGWERTDANAKIIAAASLKLEKRMLKTKADQELDEVSKRDEISEEILETEIALQEAIEVITYWAYKSPDRDRYLKRVSKNVTASQLKKIKKILDTLDYHKSWMTDEYAVDYIEKQAVSWAKSEVLVAQDNLRKKTQNIAANSK